MRVIAFIEDERVARKILEHLGLPSTVPTVKPARAPPQARFNWGEGLMEPDTDDEQDAPIPYELT